MENSFQTSFLVSFVSLVSFKLLRYSLTQMISIVRVWLLFVILNYYSIVLENVIETNNLRRLRRRKDVFDEPVREQEVLETVQGDDRRGFPN